MAIHGAFTDCLIAVGKYDLSGVSNQASMSLSVGELDSTVFGNTSRRRLPGMLDGTVDAAMIWDAATVEDAINNLPASADDDTGALTMAPSRAAGQIAYLASGCTYQTERGGAVGELYTGSISINLKRAWVLGFVSEEGKTTRSATGNGTGSQLGAVSSTQSVYATLHVFEPSASGTLDVVIQSDTVGFPTPLTRITFPQVTTSAVGRFRSAAGPITDDYFRASWTIAAGWSGKFIVGIGIR